jgi:hypothetical protein
VKEKIVLIAAPISNREKFLPYYLSNLYSLNYPKKQLSFYFIINNSQDNSLQILQQFKSNHEHEYNNITIDQYNGNRHTPNDERTNEIRLKYSYSHLSILRNMLLQYTVKNNYNYLLSVDSDIMVEPETLNKLLSANVDACAGLIYNGYIQYPDEYWKYPNILKLGQSGGFEHISNWYVKNALTLTESKLIPVDGTGAIILLSNKLCKEVKYSYHNQGEDLGFSLDCRRKKYQLYCEVSAFAYHLMNEEMLNKYIESKNKVSF